MTTKETHDNITNDINNVDIKEEKYNSSIRTRHDMEAMVTYNSFPRITSVPQSLRQDFSRILDKPVLIHTDSWSNGLTPFSSLFSLDLPESALVNDMARVPFKSSALYRTKMCVFIQVMGTPQHQGLLIASAFPYGGVKATRLNMNSYLQAPHVFLSANESTPVCLEIPFYSNTKLRRCDINNQEWKPEASFNYATLSFMVVNPLAAPTGATSSITVAIHAQFKESEFYVPANDYMILSAQSEVEDLETKVEKLEIKISTLEKMSRFRTCLACLCCVCKVKDACDDLPIEDCLTAQSVISQVVDMVASGAKTLTGDYIDRARSLVRTITGFHNPNHPFIQERMLSTYRNFTNNVDIPTFFEKLDPYANHTAAIVEDPRYYTETDEMLIANIINKPQYVGQFTVNVTDRPGDLKWSRPITPIQEKLNHQSLGFSTPLQKFAYMSRFWRGSINVHIQATMTNFHCCKLAIFKNYTANTDLLTLTTDFNDLVNLQAETLEYSAGGQIQTVNMPYCSQFDELPIIYNQSLNALVHGQYYIRLAQPLVTNGTVPSTVYFNVYISAGPDFAFYGYGIERLIPMEQGSLARAGILDNKTTFKAEEDKSKTDQHIKEKKLLAKMDEFAKGIKTIHESTSNILSAQASALVIPSDQEELLNSPPKTAYSGSRKYQPIVSVRDHMRRFITGPSYRLNSPQSDPMANQRIFQIPVNEILKYADGVVSRQSPSRIVRNFYMGQSGGYKIKAMFSGCQNASVRFYPPTMLQSDNWPTYGKAWQMSTGIFSSYAAVQGQVYRANNYPWYGNLAVDDKSPAPIIENSHVVSPEYTDYVNADKVGEGSASMSMSTIEFEIPQMNPCEFVGTGLGSISDNYATTYNDSAGIVLVSFKCDQLQNLNVPNLCMVTFMVAYADEARMGFNVYSPPVLPDHVTVGTDDFYTGPSQSVQPMSFSTITSAPNAYFGS